MAKPGIYNDYLTIGDTWRMTFTFVDANDAVIDMSGPTYTAFYHADGDAEIAMTVDSTDANTGVIIISVSHTTTSDFNVGSYYYRLISSNGADDVTTLVRGRVQVSA